MHVCVWSVPDGQTVYNDLIITVRFLVPHVCTDNNTRGQTTYATECAALVQHSENVPRAHTQTITLRSCAQKKMRPTDVHNMKNANKLEYNLKRMSNESIPPGTAERSRDANSTTCLASAQWNIQELSESYPPVWSNSNKKILAKIATPDDTTHSGTVKVSRWKSPTDLPTVVQKAHVVQEAGFYAYHPTKKYEDDALGVLHWHLNFADPVLFGYFGGPLFAQDELQVAEHPILASVARAVIATHTPTGYQISIAELWTRKGAQHHFSLKEPHADATSKRVAYTGTTLLQWTSKQSRARRPGWTLPPYPILSPLPPLNLLMVRTGKRKYKAHSSLLILAFVPWCLAVVGEKRSSIQDTEAVAHLVATKG
jgi:hypothetical protein